MGRLQTNWNWKRVTSLPVFIQVEQVDGGMESPPRHPGWLADWQPQSSPQGAGLGASETGSAWANRIAHLILLLTDLFRSLMLTDETRFLTVRGYPPGGYSCKLFFFMDIAKTF